MSLTIEPISAERPDFAGQVRGVRIADGVSAGTAAEIEQAMDRFAVLVFRDQVLDDESQFAFSRHFGPMEKASGDLAQNADRRLSDDVNDISNLDRDGQVLERDDRRLLFGLGNRLWHADSSFKETPAKYSILSARIIPPGGGDTEFADMRAAWDSLDPDTQARCMELVCEHSQIHSRGKLGFSDWTQDELDRNRPVRQRLVRRHEGSGRLSLYLSSHAGAIDGMPVPEARIFLMDLTEHATQRRFVYAHRWRQWDLVMWDNRAVMHRARPFDRTQVRDMHRTTVADRCSTLAQAV